MQRRPSSKEILIETNLYTTKYPSVVTNESTEKSGNSDPSTFSTEATVIPAKLPWPMKLTSTGKKTPASAPPTLNIREPVLLSSEALMTGIDHAREWDELSRDQSPVWDDTVGYDPSLKKGSEVGLPSQIELTEGE